MKIRYPKGPFEEDFQELVKLLEPKLLDNIESARKVIQAFSQSTLILREDGIIDIQVPKRYSSDEEFVHRIGLVANTIISAVCTRDITDKFGKFRTQITRK